jgi:hypothetical protein
MIHYVPTHPIAVLIYFIVTIKKRNGCILKLPLNLKTHRIAVILKIVNMQDRIDINVSMLTTLIRVNTNVIKSMYKCAFSLNMFSYIPGENLGNIHIMLP